MMCFMMHLIRLYLIKLLCWLRYVYVCCYCVLFPRCSYVQGPSLMFRQNRCLQIFNIHVFPFCSICICSGPSNFLVCSVSMLYCNWIFFIHIVGSAVICRFLSSSVMHDCPPIYLPYC